MHDRLEIGNEIGQTRLQSEHEGTGQPDPVESGSHAQRHEDGADQRCTTIRGHAKVALDNEIISDSCRAGRHVSIEPKTGLAGMGDLVLTCTGALSRNRSVGVALGRGKALANILDETRWVAEGVKTTVAVLQLAARRGVEMPLASFVRRVLYEGARPADLVPELMLRKAKPELHGMR